jgi:uncharacterized protein
VFRRNPSAIGPAGRPRGIRIAAGALGALALLAAVIVWLLAERQPVVLGRGEAALPPPVAVVRSPAPPPPSSEDAALTERGASGPLPIVAADGRKSWRVYARPFDVADSRPRLAVAIGGLGQAAEPTRAAIGLPGPVSLVFSPYSRELGQWIGEARAAGHEVLLGLPMEPLDFPHSDPGPHTLLTTLSPAQNLDRLEWVMSRAGHYVGLNNLMGSRFTTSPDAMKPILEVLKGRGLLFLETRASNQSAVAPLAEGFQLPHAADDRNFDGDLTRSGIDQAIADLEQIARRRGSAVGIGSAYPITLDRIAAWAATLEGKGLVLAPVSALVSEKPEKAAAQ